MSVTVKTTGFKEADRALGELGKALGKGVLRRVGKAALEPIADRARQYAPVATGGLRESIAVGTSLTKTARRNERGETRSSVTIYAGTSNAHAVEQEFGTVKHPPHPFMRPAWDAEQGTVLENVARDLRPEIEKTAARAAKRKARG